MNAFYESFNIRKEMDAGHSGLIDGLRADVARRLQYRALTKRISFYVDEVVFESSRQCRKCATEMEKKYGRSSS